MGIEISCIMHTSNFTALQQEYFDIRMLSTYKLNIYKLQTTYSGCSHYVIAMNIMYGNLICLHRTGVPLCFILRDRHLLVLKHSILNILHVRDIDSKQISILFSTAL
jgi:hypothetical protein